MILFRIPPHAWPALFRYSIGRRVGNRLRARPAPELSDSDLDFFLGGTDSVTNHLTQPTFRFFAASDFSTGHSLTDDCSLILAHRLHLLGQTFAVGNPIQWRRDFRTGHEWPLDPISQLKLVTTQGDVKIPWELSRFQHGLTLALGFAASGDTRYADEWAAQFHAWRAANPPEQGPNWGNAMEAALRAANWIAAYSIFTSVGAIRESPLPESPLLKALIQHGRFIFSYLEHYWPPTNHILADLCGLIWIGLFLRPDSKNEHASLEPQRWLDYGLSELQKQLRFQILPDGASYEASTAYHRFMTEMVASTVRLCELNSIFVPSALRQTVTQMEAVVDALRKPDGSLPLFGDEDGGKFPSPLGTLSAVEEAPGWSSFPQAGWYIYRDQAEYLAIRAGNNGQAGWGGHAHNDALSFEYAVGQRTFLIDPGTYTYTTDPEARNLFRSTAYHNTLRVDQQEISRMPPGELFRLENDVTCKGISCKGDSRIAPTFWKGEHTGYRRLGVIHKRRFEKQDSGWLICDTVLGNGEHDLEWFFHFAPGCPVQMAGLKVWTEYPSGPNLSLISNFKLLTSDLQPGWSSPTYGRRQPALVICYSLKSKLPFEVEFIITKT